MVEVAFVTSNPGKVREARALLAPYGVTVRWLRRTLPEPQAESLEEVARAKLAAVGPRSGYVLVEDSGLFVRSLGGFPGVYSAHLLKLWRFGPILELLRRRDRRASYRAVAALSLGNRRWTFRGEVRGAIARAPRGRNGFGYDPIFVPRGFDRTFGELPPSTKDQLSHRARALRSVGRFLAKRERPKGRRAGRAVRTRSKERGRKRLG